MDHHRATAQEAYRFLEASWRGATRVGQATFETARRLHAVVTETNGPTDNPVGWDVALRTTLQEAGRVGRLALESAHHHARAALASRDPSPRPIDDGWEVVQDADADPYSSDEGAELNDRWDDNGALFDDEPLAGGYTLADLVSDSDSDSAGDGHPSSSSSSSSEEAPPPPPPPPPPSSTRRVSAPPRNPFRQRPSTPAPPASPPATREPAPQQHARRSHRPREENSDHPSRSSSTTGHNQPSTPTPTPRSTTAPAPRPSPPPFAPPPTQLHQHRPAPRSTHSSSTRPPSAATTDDDASPASLPRTTLPGAGAGPGARRHSQAPGGGTTSSAMNPPPPSPPPAGGAGRLPSPSISDRDRDRLVPTRMSGGRAGGGSRGGLSQTSPGSGPAAPMWTLDIGYDRVDGRVRGRIAEVVRRARGGGGGE